MRSTKIRADRRQTSSRILLLDQIAREEVHKGVSALRTEKDWSELFLALIYLSYSLRQQAEQDERTQDTSTPMFIAFHVGHEIFDTATEMLLSQETFWRSFDTPTFLDALEDALNDKVTSVIEKIRT